MKVVFNELTLALRKLRVNRLFENINNWLCRSNSHGSGMQPIDILDEICVLGSTLGCVRTENQDRAVFMRYTSNVTNHSFLLFALCDGIGGMRDGRICANIALAEMIQHMVINREQNKHLQECLDIAIRAANEKIFVQYNGQGGTTLSVVAVDKKDIIGSNVGDSRIYQYDDRSLNQISIDDTIEARMNIKNEFSKGLIQYVGMGNDLIPNKISISTEMGILITSDGVHNVGDDDLKKIIKYASSSNDIVKKLLYLSSWFGGQDNASLIVLPKKAISILHNFLNEKTSDYLIEIYDCFKMKEISFPVQKKARTPVKKPIATTEPSSNLSASPIPKSASKSKRGQGRSVEKSTLNIEVGKKG